MAKDITPYSKALRESDDVPREVLHQQYKGPGEGALGATRGMIFGGLGYVVGRWLGRLGSLPEFLSEGRKLTGNAMGLAMGSFGGLFGMYHGIKEARLYHQQMQELQYYDMELHQRVDALRSELKAQLHHRYDAPDKEGVPKPLLTHFDPEWEKKPTTRIEAESISKGKQIADKRQQEQSIAG